MYTSFFGLNEKPFSITPDPRYLYMSERHTEALAHLIYGITEAGGFVQLTGEVGTGKTTLVRGLLQQLPDNAEIALVLNPQLSRIEFLAAICEELGIDEVSDINSVKALNTSLNNYLLQNHSEGRKTILLVDEAQNLATDVLEQVRLLTNLETSQQKLLQITLVGQPELRELLARNDLRQLAQRITGRYHLEPLTREETQEYIRHRLTVAGGSGAIFSDAACREVFRLSQGVPRIINVICDRALLGGFTEEKQVITPSLVRQAAREVYDLPATAVSPWSRRMKPILTGLGIAAGVIAAVAAGMFLGPQLLNRADDSAQPVAEARQTNSPAMTAESPLISLTDSDPLALPGESLDAFLSRNSRYTDTESAFTTLFSLWGVDYLPTADVRACDQALDYRLSCLLQRGSLAQLQTLDRPAILTLRDTESVLHNVVIVALSDDSATIEVQGEQLEVPIVDLLSTWFGDFLMLWSPQIQADSLLAPGDTDPNVRWLRDSMAAIQSWNPGTVDDPDYYDAILADRVRSYQRSRRLNVDGLVGEETLITINTDLGIPDTPLLLSRDSQNLASAAETGR